AYTDNEEIYINTGNYITRSFPTRVLKADSLIGMNAHEIGHILYTDFSLSSCYFKLLEKGRVFSDEPADFSEEEKEALTEMEQYLKTGSGIAKAAILKAAKHILNILEDAYIEARVCEAYPGKFAVGITLNNIRFSEMVPSVDEQLKNGNYRFSVFTNMLLQYCNGGDFNNRDNYEGEILEHFLEVLPLVDHAIYEPDMQERCNATNRIMVSIWEYVKEIVEKAEERQREKRTTDSESRKDLEEELNEQIVRTAHAPFRGGSPIPLEDISGPDTEGKEKLREKLSDALEHESAEGAEVDVCDKISKLLKEIAKDTVEAKLYDELTKELEEDAKHLVLGSAHTDVNIRIERKKDVDEGMIFRYECLAKELLPISKQMQKRLKRLFKDTAYTEKMTALPMGRRLEPRLLSDKEGRIFSRKRLPSEKKDLAVALLLDESGSMSWCDRIRSARNAAIIVYDFCKAMDISVMIMGHTEHEDVVLYPYTDFDSCGEKDRYRLMDISARRDNRDGAALRYVAERLLKQPEEKKLLMLVSDGQPLARGYSGLEAEDDLRSIKQEFSNKGVLFVAAAIGSDKENIERIYGSSFLDITDLNELPFLLVRKIERALKG
ncbi:MAG: nitric oxide reductase activation protein NorD, partial [Anaerotignum sp.]|nr:nitric oxide reductase activation protein NorD [Anaerotignum sp.]